VRLLVLCDSRTCARSAAASPPSAATFARNLLHVDLVKPQRVEGQVVFGHCPDVEGRREPVEVGRPAVLNERRPPQPRENQAPGPDLAAGPPRQPGPSGRASHSSGMLSKCAFLVSSRRCCASSRARAKMSPSSMVSRRASAAGRGEPFATTSRSVTSRHAVRGKRVRLARRESMRGAEPIPRRKSSHSTYTSVRIRVQTERHRLQLRVAPDRVPGA
jgi:hypothetical protein